MREIKFRVWDKRENRFWSQKEITEIGGFYYNWGVTTPEELYPNRFVLQQYTELKDKNGVEIYEGDIIQECKIGETIWDGDGTIKECPTGIVEWDYSGYNIKQVKIGLVILKNGTKSELYLEKYDGQFQWDGTEIEVIGNIYENPELLKEK